jgi:transcriptional regulator with XRE-family HTH domain
LFALKYRAIGLKISYYRKRKGLTQAQLAELIGISTNYLGMIERGNNGQSYSMEVLLKLAEALDVDAQELMREN